MGWNDRKQLLRGPVSLRSDYACATIMHICISVGNRDAILHCCVHIFVPLCLCVGSCGCTCERIMGECTCVYNTAVCVDLWDRAHSFW